MLSFLKSFSSNIHAKYSVSQKESFRVGPWGVYDAKSRSSKELASVFILDKRALADSLSDAGIKPKSSVTQEIYEFANRGVAQLAKLRHPSIIKLIEPMEQSKGSLLFVTERVTTSLQRLVRAKGSNSELEGDELDELSIERGLAVLVQGLLFLHDQLGYVHLNVSPASVLVDASGDWKLFGLEFLESYREHTGNYFLPQLDPRLPAYIHPSVDYLAPELAIDHELTPQNDVFALACLIYAVYTGKSALSTRNNPGSYKEEYTRFARKLNTLTIPGRISTGLLTQLFERNPNQRIKLETFADSDYFNNSLVKALQFLDDFAAKGPNEKIQFLKYFNGVLDQLPKNIRHRKVLKFAIQELKGPREAATGLLLGNLMFGLAKDMSRLSFSEQILPLFDLLKDYPQFQESVVTNIQTVVKGTTDKDFTKTVLPLLLDVLKTGETGQSSVQKMLLTETEVFIKNITVSGLEQSLFPAVLDLFSATPAKSVKIAACTSFVSLLNTGLSKPLIQDKLIPALQNMKTRDPEVVVAVQSLYDPLSSKASPGLIMEKIIPHLGELAMSPGLTVVQFRSIFTMIRRELDKVEESQVGVLRNNKEPEVTKQDDMFISDVDTQPKASHSQPMPWEVSSKPAAPAQPAQPNFFDPLSSTPARPAQTVQPVAQPLKPPTQPLQPAKPIQQSSFAPLKPTSPTMPSFGQTQNSFSTLQPSQPARTSYGQSSFSPAPQQSSFSTLQPQTNHTQTNSFPSLQPMGQTLNTSSFQSSNNTQFTPLQPQKWQPLQPSQQQQNAKSDDFGDFSGGSLL